MCAEGDLSLLYLQRECHINAILHDCELFSVNASVHTGQLTLWPSLSLGSNLCNSSTLPEDCASRTSSLPALPESHEKQPVRITDCEM